MLRLSDLTSGWVKSSRLVLRLSRQLGSSRECRSFHNQIPFYKLSSRKPTNFSFFISFLSHNFTTSLPTRVLHSLSINYSLVFTPCCCLRSLSTSSGLHNRFKMYTALIPYLMDAVSFALVIICLTAGHSPRWLPGISVVSLNTTEFKANYSKIHGGYELPIHDVYSLYMSNHCDGYQVNDTSQVANWTCSKPTPGREFALISCVK